MSLRSAGTFIGAWMRSRGLDRLRDRAHLEFLQQQWTARLLAEVAERSPYYRSFAGRPLEDWPVMSKNEWMAHFDEINTAGARLSELNAFAANAETTRNFSPTWHGHTVGFSTGTSGHRGLFFVSPEERARWAGTLFGRMLRLNPLREERLALVLRAGSPLYERASTLRLRFRYFDQAQPWDAIVRGLDEYQPTILVAPARVLALLARDAARLRPRRVISVAEVLDDLDRARIETAFGVRAEQIYQATEGLLGTTCESGTLHLMEPYVLIEPQWLDAERTRFTPLVTDLWRRTQPVIRYRMNDVLRVKREPCACGRAAMAIDAIDGRMDDLLWLDSERGAVCVFPDLVTREIVVAVPQLDDYRITELSRGRWSVDLHPLPPEPIRQQLVARLQALASRLGASPPVIAVGAFESQPLLQKQRRVQAARITACAS
jgi:putative adenylate-forming enzyme